MSVVIGYPSSTSPDCGRVKRLLSRFVGGRGPWGLADQVLISGTNFVTMVFAARGMGKAEFGRFSLVYNVLLLLNIIQVAMVSQPHNVLGVGRGKGKAYRSFTGSIAGVQVLILAVQGAVAVGWVLWASHRRWDCLPLLTSLIPAMAAWALQEFFRRILYTEGRRLAAFLNDIVAYGGQAVWIIALWWSDTHRSSASATMTGSQVMYVLGATSGAAALLGFFQVGPSLRGKVRFSTWRESWSFGKWLLASEVVVYFSSLPTYMYLVGWFVSASASGELKAAQTLFGPTRIISYFLATVLPIRFATEMIGGGNAALRRAMSHAAVRVLPIVGAFCIVMAACARPLLMLFGHDFSARPRVLVMYAAVAFCAFIQMLLSAALTAKHLTRDIFFSTIAGAGVTLFLGLPLTRYAQIDGALVAMLLTAIAITAMLWRSYRTHVLDAETGESLPSMTASTRAASAA